ncbi:TonB family protein [Aurantiacibacter sp. MUD11]|uniref:energy transducer TonB n=1 Tax=Aurantiacibacter sp. MUD11 TaxID=3003265 RepID=UPI0022AAAB15|nr:TonB family protein [Aurantiacibacter sp. MUD11]WAT17106.1 TonB family protein [Aurantiacibacter sp. MUD11]
MKKLVTATIAIAVFGAPLYAQDTVEEGTILVQPERATFVSNIERELDRQLYRTPYPGGIREAGVVKVQFVANAEGRAEQVRLFEDSGSVRMDHAALRAVQRLDNLGSSRSADDGGQDVLLTIVFANSEREAERLVERVADENAALVASGALDPQVLAITMVPATRS